MQNYQLAKTIFKLFSAHKFMCGVAFCIGSLEAQEYPEPIGWVNDFVDVITPEYENRLTNLIAEVKKKTTAEIAIATVPTTGSESIDMYAVELFTRWGVGKSGKDNGVLIVAAIDDRKVWIEVGYGLEGVLPDGLCGEIYRKILTPNFRQGEFGKGLFLATTVIADRIGKEYNVEITGAEGAPTIRYERPSGVCGICGLLGPLIFIFIFFLLFGRLGLFGLFPLLFFGSGRGYWGSGTFGGGGGFSGGFGGFGGGSCGGGGAGGSW